jgi:hypothetical protein
MCAECFLLFLDGSGGQGIGDEMKALACATIGMRQPLHPRVHPHFSEFRLLMAGRLAWMSPVIAAAGLDQRAEMSRGCAAFKLGLEQSLCSCWNC